VLIAEAFQLDTGTVVLIVLIALGMLLLVATATGLVGVMIGVAIARRSQSPEARLALKRGKRGWVGLVGVAATLGAWIFLLTVGSSITDNGFGLVPVFLGGFALAVVWGWWTGRWYRFSDEQADR